MNLKRRSFWKVMDEIDLLKWKHDINMNFLRTLFNAYILRQGTIVAAGIALLQVFNKLVIALGMVAFLIISQWKFERSIKGVAQASVELENLVTERVMRRRKR